MQSLWNPFTFLPGSEEPEENFPINYLEEIDNQSRVVLQKYEVPVTPLKAVNGREVGDDRADWSLSARGLAIGLAVQESIFMMKTSAEDTFISKELFNFCEVTTFIPSDPAQSFDHCRRTGDFTDLGFTDTVVLRLILDVKKGDGDEHSSTTPGKMHMLRSRLETPRKEARKTWQLASLFQDANLSSNLADEPKYLPTQLGGSGVPPLFDNWKNLYLYVHSYKGGTYQRIYASATAELRSSMAGLMSESYTAPLLSSRLREKQEYFWGTYDSKIFVPDKKANLLPLLEAGTGIAYYTGFTNRLERSRRTLPERGAEAEMRRTQHLLDIFTGERGSVVEAEELSTIESKRARAQFDGALSAKAAFQNLLRRTAGPHDVHALEKDPSFQVINTGRQEFLPEDALWLYGRGSTGEYRLDDLYYPSRVFARDEVSSEETLKVSGISLRPPLTGKEILSTSKVGLYQINHTMEEWSDLLLSLLKERRDEKNRSLRIGEFEDIFEAHPEWVNDDKGLIGKVLRSLPNLPTCSVGLVTADRRLANQMAETCNVVVYRSDPLELIKLYKDKKLVLDEHADSRLLFERAGLKPRICLVDSGSLAARAARMTFSGDDLYERTLIETTSIEGTRMSQVSYKKINRTPRRETHRPLKGKKWRGSKPFDEVYSSHSSWDRASRPSTIYQPSSNAKSWYRSHTEHSERDLSSNWRAK